jgi:hypothetical protein
MATRRWQQDHDVHETIMISAEFDCTLVGIDNKLTTALSGDIGKNHHKNFSKATLDRDPERSHITGTSIF